jgi:hypothetical protein
VTARFRALLSADTVAAIVLLALAVVPVSLGAIHVESESVSAAHQVRVVAELENRRAFGRGILPLWDAFQFGGRAHLADPAMQAFYPPHAIGRLLPLDLFCLVTVGVHAWAAGMGAYLVARQLAISRLPSIAAAMAVMLATVFAPAMGVAHSPGVFTLAWVPFTLAFAMRTTARSALLPHAGLVVAITFAFMTASLRGAVYAVAAAVAWLAFAALWSSPSRHLLGRGLVQVGLLAVLVAGLAAVQAVPSVVHASVAPRAGLFRDDGARDGDRIMIRPEGWDARLAQALAPVRRGRVVSTCGPDVDAALVAHGIPIVGGHGGGVHADYARFINLVSGRFPESRDVYRPLELASGTPTRHDLLQLLDAEYLVSCDTPDAAHWTRVGDVDGIGIYESAGSIGRAAWTCPPVAVSREELEYRLERHRYDSTLTLHDAGPVIHVRWASDVDETDRARAEAMFGIGRERALGERTWQYELTDTSFSNVAEIVTSPLVDDTAGLDRARFVPVSIPPPAFEGLPKTEWLLGSERCPATRRAQVLAKDREDGGVVVVIDAPRDGMLFLSETYSPERLAWLDGHAVDALKVNLAFTGIRVPSGRHRVELSYDARGVRLGTAMSGLSILAWFLCAWRIRSTRS